MSRRPLVDLTLVAFLTLLTSCRSEPRQPVEALGPGTGNVSRLALRSLDGMRDGERLDVRATFSDGSQVLDVQLHIDVTPPARLVAGTWNGFAGRGQVREQSLTFLGGQAGAPSVGGTFALLSLQDQPLYRVAIPLQELKQPIGRAPVE